MCQNGIKSVGIKPLIGKVNDKKFALLRHAGCSVKGA